MERGLQTIDATCPLVTKVHREAVRFAEDGYTIVLVGHDGHEEVEGTMGEAPERIVLVQDEADVESWRSRIPDRIAYVTQTTLAVDETAADHRAAARALPQDRRSAHRRHLLRHHQPPGGRQADGRQLRPDARDRLAQLLELGPPGRGRARLRHRGAPDRQRRRSPGGVAGGPPRRRASPRARARRRTSSPSWSSSSASAGCRTSPSSTSSARTSASCSPSRSAKPSPRAGPPDRPSRPGAAVGARSVGSRRRRTPLAMTHADHLRPAPRQRLRRRPAAPRRAARAAAGGARRCRSSGPAGRRARAAPRTGARGDGGGPAVLRGSRPGARQGASS